MTAHEPMRARAPASDRPRATAARPWRARREQMRGSRRRAAASIEKPNVSAPLRIRVSALLQAPSAMRRRCRWRRTSGRAGQASTIATTKPFSVATSGVMRVLARKEGRRQRLDQHMGGQAERQPHQRMRRRRGVGRGEGAVLEQQPHDRFAQHDQAERRRQRQPDREFERRAIPHAQRRRGRRCARRASAPAPAPCPWRRRRCRAAARPGGWRNRATTPRMATTEAMIAPATISNCGPLLAIMPGMALAKKPRISCVEAKSAAASRCTRASREHQHQQLQQAGDADGRRQHHARQAGIRCQTSSIAITAISAMLNSSGENAVSAKRPCAFSSAIITVTGPAKAR